MKASERNRCILVIMQTAAAAPKQVWEGLNAGCYSLTKPFKMETLISIVNSGLADLREQRLFTITDEGNGLDWTQYLDFDPEYAFAPQR